MLMLTHTWLLRMFLGPHLSKSVEPDLYIHNVSPDILPIHKDITTDMTHGAERLSRLPQEYKKANFTQFHLLVDDIAHYGRICKDPGKTFNPDSGGYPYRKGRMLIEPLVEFHRGIGHRISYHEAAYRSHIIIEIAFDQVLQDGDEPYDILPLFFGALHYTVEDKMEDFCRTSSWFYGIREATIAEALKKGKEKCTRESPEPFASFAGRVALYIGKFGLDRHDDATWSGLSNILLQGMDMVSDYEDYLAETIKAIRETGFTSSL